MGGAHKAWMAASAAAHAACGRKGWGAQGRPRWLPAIRACRQPPPRPRSRLQTPLRRRRRPRLLGAGPQPCAGALQPAIMLHGGTHRCANLRRCQCEHWYHAHMLHTHTSNAVYGSCVEIILGQSPCTQATLKNKNWGSRLAVQPHRRRVCGPWAERALGSCRAAAGARAHCLDLSKRFQRLALNEIRFLVAQSADTSRQAL